MTTYWLIESRDERGHAIRLRRLADAHPVTDGAVVVGYRVGLDLFHPDDVVTHGAHHCAGLAELDCYAVLGDNRAAALARWHEAHPDGPTTPEEFAEEQALRAGFRRRSLSA